MATVNGGAGNDTLAGGSQGDVINGFGANDLLIGHGGNDQIFGGAGIDTINGGPGDDTIFGGSGVDEMIGGAGIDTMSTFFFNGNYVFNLATGVTNFTNETATGFENATMGNGSDVVTGSAVANFIHTNGGNDRLLGVGGNDSLFGGLGADTIEGGAGNDQINGGLGFDRVSGGQGFDTFSFTAPLNQVNSGPDRILDFNHAADSIGLDHTVFTGLAVGALPVAAFHAGTNASEASHRIIYDDTTGNLFFDPDGTGATGKTKFAQVDPNSFVLSDDFSVF